MPRLAQLPPRFPPRNSGPSSHFMNPDSHKVDELSQLTTQREKFVFQGSLIEEQPLWVDDLLADCGTMTKISPLRRAVSDPVTILEESLSFDFSMFPIHEEPFFPSQGLCETQISKDDASRLGGPGCLYGPNSPRTMESLTDSDSNIVSAIFGSVNQNHMQYAANAPDSSGTCESRVKEDIFVTSDDNDPEKLSRRHTGQRSRVRKLQYIAELEGTVNFYQAVEADLATKVASLFHQRALLSLENSTLKQKMNNLRKEKAIKDGQQQFLKTELKKLKAECIRKNIIRNSTWASSDALEKDPLHFLDMGELSLGENPPLPRHGFKG